MSHLAGDWPARASDNGPDESDTFIDPGLLISDVPGDPYPYTRDDAKYLRRIGAEVRSCLVGIKLVDESHREPGQPVPEGQLPHDYPKDSAAAQLERLVNKLRWYWHNDLPARLPGLFASARYARNKRRMFQGNRNYLEFFNAQVAAFVEFRQRIPDAPSLKQSEVSIDGTVRYYEDEPVREEFKGILWTAEEKDKFFQLLGRYSIHRIDDIAAQLPGKTVSQVQTYYDTLKRALREFKTSPSRSSRLVSMDEIPAAWEMTEEFISFEESQAERIASVATRKDQARVERASKRAMTIAPPSDLIDWSEMRKLGTVFYRYYFDRKLLAPLNAEVQRSLEDLVVCFTYSLLLGLTERKLAETPLSLVSHRGGRMLVDLSTSEIRKEAEKLMKSRPAELRSYWASMMRNAGMMAPSKPKSNVPVGRRAKEEQREIERKINASMQPSPLGMSPASQMESKQNVDFATALSQVRPVDSLGYVSTQDHIFATPAVDPNVDPDLYALDQVSQPNVTQADVPQIPESTETSEVSISVSNSESESEVEAEQTDSGAQTESDFTEGLRPDSSSRFTSPSPAAQFFSSDGSEPPRKVSKADLEFDDGDFGFDRHMTAGELDKAEKLFLMESSALNKFDTIESLKHERKLLGLMSCHPDDLDKNDWDASRLYVSSLYYPEQLPTVIEFKGRKWAREQRIKNSRQRAGDEAFVRTATERRAAAGNPEDMPELYHWAAVPMRSGGRIPLSYDRETGIEYTEYDEDNPEVVTSFPDVADDEVFDSAYEFATYE